jgi:hypothetical protein
VVNILPAQAQQKGLQLARAIADDLPKHWRGTTCTCARFL